MKAATRQGGQERIVEPQQMEAAPPVDERGAVAKSHPRQRSAGARKSSPQLLGARNLAVEGDQRRVRLVRLESDGADVDWGA